MGDKIFSTQQEYRFFIHLPEWNVVRADDIPSASKLQCVQNLKNWLERYSISFEEEMRGRFFKYANLMGKNIFRAEETSFPV